MASVNKTIKQYFDMYPPPIGLSASAAEALPCPVAQYGAKALIILGLYAVLRPAPVVNLTRRFPVSFARSCPAGWRDSHACVRGNYLSSRSPARYSIHRT